MSDCKKHKVIKDLVYLVPKNSLVDGLNTGKEVWNSEALSIHTNKLFFAITLGKKR